MSSEADKKSPLSDPLLVLIALLLLLAAGAALYFMANGPSKEFAHEPGARPRPIITNHVVILNVQEVVAAATPGAVHAAAATQTHTSPVAETVPKSAAETPVAAKPAEPVAVTLNPPQLTATTDGKMRGRVILKGTPPPEKLIGAVKGDQNCGPVAVGTAMTRNYVVGPDGGLRNAMVRIVKAPAGAGTKPDSFLMDQVGCMYEPYVTVVMTGETLKIRNSDPFLHNVNATPKVAGNKGFNISQGTQGQVNEKTFDKPELGIRFACQVHPWMIAYVNVVENPFFALTNEKGEFELPPGLPPGQYELEVNHLKAGMAKQKIEIAADKGAEVVFELAPAAAK